MTLPLLIYRGRLLGISETFIRSQAEAFLRYTPYYLGGRPMDGIMPPPERTLFIGNSGPVGFLRENLYKTFHFAPRLIEELKRIRPALIHAHFGHDGVDAIPIARALDLPLVTTFHGFDATTKDEFIQRNRAGRRYLRGRAKLGVCGSMFIAVSEFISLKVRHLGFPESRIRVHYIGVDIEMFKPNPGVLRERLILFVGRLVEKKGCEYLIRATASLQSEIKGLRLAIIGDGQLRTSLEQLARAESCNCQFLGAQKPEAVRQWMNKARVFCTPSITAESGDAEGFGIVFAEAQAMEVPVVSFASGGVREAVEDGVTGFLAPERDWRALASHLRALLTDDALWRRFSFAARDRVCVKFNLKHQTALLEDIYETVLEEWHSNSASCFRQ